MPRPTSLFSGGRAGFSALDLSSLAGVDAESNNPLYNVGKFLSRPLYAVTSALSGEFGDAAENVAQFLMDAPTGGFLNRNWSLANLFDETGDITTKAERPEFTDLTRRWGLGRPSSRLGRTAMDVLGGMALDPLTYLSFGASTIGKGMLTGMGRSAAMDTLAAGLRKTATGTRYMDDALSGLTKHQRASGSLRGMREALEQGGDVAMGRLRGVEQAAAGKVFQNQGKYKGALAAADADNEFLNAGVKHLEQAGALERGGWRAGLPFTKGALIPGTEGAHPLKLTAPYMGYKALGKVAPPLAETARQYAETGWTWLKGTLYDKTLLGKVSEGTRHAARQAAYKHAQEDFKAKALVEKLWEGVTPDQRVLAREAWESLHDETIYLHANQADFAKKFSHLREARELPMGWTEDRLMRAAVHGDEVVPKGIGPAIPKKILIDARGGKMTKAQVGRFLKSQADDTLRKAGLDPEALRPALDAYDESMRAIQSELVSIGVWKGKVPKDFYVPRQIVPQLSELLSQAHGNDVIRRGLMAFKDRFTQARKFNTLEEFEAALQKIAEDGGLGDLKASLGGVLDETDIGALHLQRLLAHNKTVHHRTLWNKSKKLWADEAGVPKNVARYLNAQLEQIPARSNGLSVFLGGGHFKLKAPQGGWSQDMVDKANKNGWKIKDGTLHMPFKGINYYYKPSLTSHPQNVGFHARNATAALLMGTFDPDIGFGQGAKAFAEAVGLAPVVRKLGVDWRPNEVATFLRAMEGQAVDLAALKGKTVGKYTALEVVEQLKGLVGGRRSQADIMQSIGATTALGGEQMRTGAFGAYDKWTKLGETMANHVESSFRASAYMDLVKKGVNPTEAARRVERAFVKYDINSSTERAIRDTFPFARFMFGSAAWTGEFMRRPRTMTPLARIQQSATEEGTILPESVQGGLAIPLWKDANGETQYLTGLGTPQEAAFGLVSAGTSAEGMRRSGLGSMHPLLKLPLEQATNRNFYFGGEAGQYRRKPWYIPEGLAQEIETPTGTRYEVPGILNELMGATPMSRALKYPDILSDDRKSLAQRLGRTLTGMRSVSVDQQRAARKALAKRAEREVDRGRLYKIPAFGARKLKGGKTPEDLENLLKALRQTSKAPKKRSIFD